jgi:modulator of FtsH protease HflC
MREKWFTVLVIFLLLIGLGAYMFVYTVKEHEVVVHERFGKTYRVVRPRFRAAGATGVADADDAGQEQTWEVANEAGWYFKIPLVDKTRTLDQRITYLDLTPTQMTLQSGDDKDQQVVIPRIFATWRIVDPVTVVKKFRGQERELRLAISKAVIAEVANVMGMHPLGHLVNTDQSQLRFDEIEAEILQNVRDELTDNPIGVAVYTLGITWIQLPSQTTPEVFNRMASERKIVSARYRSEGEAESSRIIALAREQAGQITSEAEGRAIAIRGQAVRLQEEAYAAFALNPELHAFLREMEAFKKITQNARSAGSPLSFILTTATAPFTILTGALPKVMTPVPMRVPEPVAPPKAAADLEN